MGLGKRSIVSIGAIALAIGAGLTFVPVGAACGCVPAGTTLALTLGVDPMVEAPDSARGALLRLAPPGTPIADLWGVLQAGHDPQVGTPCRHDAPQRRLLCSYDVEQNFWWTDGFTVEVTLDGNDALVDARVERFRR